MFTVTLTRLLSVGASFTGVTPTLNVRLAVPPLASATCTVMAAEPFCLDSGVTDTVRFAPDPPNTIFAVGIRPGFEEVAESVRLEAAVSVSPIVIARGPVDVFSLMT